MSFFSDQIKTVGEKLDGLAGIQAKLVRGEQEKTITCVPIRLNPEFIGDVGAIRQEFQDFYLFRNQLGDLFPQPDDKIETDTETWQVVGGKSGNTGTPAVEILESTGQRIRIHTVRIKK